MSRNCDDNTFEELLEVAGPGVAQAHSSPGCAFGDFDNDGNIDMLIINLKENPSLACTTIFQGKQIGVKVKLEGVKSNRSAVGARVLAHYGEKTQAQCVLSQSSLYSCNDPCLHLNLGNYTSISPEVPLAQRTRGVLRNI